MQDFQRRGSNLVKKSSLFTIPYGTFGRSYLLTYLLTLRACSRIIIVIIITKVDIMLNVDQQL